jgi:hypothetical protein
MGLLNRSGEKQTLRERGELRRHLDDLGDLREEKLRELGGIAVGMHRGGGFDRDALWEAASAIAAIDDEARLVRRGLDEGLTLAQLEELSRESSGAAAGEDPAPEKEPAPAEAVSPPQAEDDAAAADDSSAADDDPAESAPASERAAAEG